MSNFFPIFIDIKGKKCVVVGGGTVAERKIKKLLKYGADITVISPDITHNIQKLVEKGKIEYLRKNYSKNDIKNAFLVIAATSDSKINTQILKNAQFLVNSVEKKEIVKKTNNIEFIVPAIFEKGHLKIAVSTEFPALSRTIKEELQYNYGKEFALYLKFLKTLRKEIKDKIKDSKKRQKLFKKIASKQIVSILRQYGFKRAKEEIDRIINEV
ncbi:MAG: NAD-binding protein [Thermodesulfovibrio sp.]|nr:NAD-binding protein [Thermodesulfovibrio sp.]